MRQQLPRYTIFDRARYFVFLALIGLCFLGGGASRPDVVSLLYLRPAAIICLVLLLSLPGERNYRAVRFPLIALAVLAAIILFQLIPLPPSLWLSLPGHAQFGDAAAAAGIDQPWRPISVSPDMTLNSLASLVIPLAALIGMATIRREQLPSLLPILLGAGAISALFGIAQLAGGSDSGFYLYRITNDTAAVGLFANRNHQALLLACMAPMLALWASRPLPAGRAMAVQIVGIAFCLLLIPMVLVTGSRSGAVLIVVALGLAYFQMRRNGRTVFLPGLSGRWSKAVKAVPWLLGGGLIAAAILLSRAKALDRLLTEDSLGDVRWTALPVFARIAKDFFPFGAGFGTFDPVYRIYEPVEALSPAYLNHAHNDVMELLITAGLPGAILAIGFVAWWLLGAARAFRRRDQFSVGTGLARVGAVVILLVFAMSLVDYPLRTPIFALLFAIACGWLGQAGSKERSVPHAANSTE